MKNAGKELLQEAVLFLTEVFMPKIECCLEELSDAEIWRRPNDASNSIGNLVLHLSGNVRQWIISGLGGQTDIRVRQQEFDQREIIPRAELLRALSTTVNEAAAILRSMDPDRLTERRTIQNKEVSVLHAVFHVVEHFSMHTGQIIMMTKLMTAKDLRFYDMSSGAPVERWKK